MTAASASAGPVSSSTRLLTALVALAAIGALGYFGESNESGIDDSAQNVTNAIALP